MLASILVFRYPLGVRALTLHSSMEDAVTKRKIHCRKITSRFSSALPSTTTRGSSSASLIDLFLNTLKAFSSLSFFVAVISILSSCTSNDLKEPVEYTGPLRKIEKVELYYTEKNAIKVKMIADE